MPKGETMSEFTMPGQLIANLLQERGWSSRNLAVVLEKDETTISKIITGKGAVTTETALALEDIFGVKAEIFLELQRQYDLAVARLSARPDKGRAMRATLFADLPITVMAKRGWIDASDPQNMAQVEAGLIKFFGVSSLEEIELLPHAAKKTQVNTPVTPAQMAWLYRVRKIAEEMMVAPFSNSSLERAITNLRQLMIAPEEARKVPRILAEAGVRFVIVESLPSAKIDGVCFWLDDQSPVVGLSMRHDRIDNFWFVLMHELEHVLRRHGMTNTTILDTELEGVRAGSSEDIPQEEREANKAAQEFCVPTAKMDAFIARKDPFFAERDLIAFASILGVHPGIIAGQLQHRTNRYDRFRQHLASIRHNVSTSAAVDGWGDIYPVTQ
jgi:HTH-type transcriptional regulator / antitoxin HigA